MQRPVSPTAEAVERALAEVYARPELREPEVPGPLRWLRELREALKGLWLDLLSGLQALEAASPLLYRLTVVLLIALAVALLFHLGRSLARALRTRERSRAAPRPRHAPSAARDWEAEARRAAAEGRLREAALFLYQALLRRFEARGAIRWHAAKTPGDYRREAARDPEAARLFEAFLRVFEPIAWGRRAADAGAYDRLRSIAAEAGARG